MQKITSNCKLIFPLSSCTYTPQLSLKRMSIDENTQPGRFFHSLVSLSFYSDHKEQQSIGFNCTLLSAYVQTTSWLSRKAGNCTKSRMQLNYTVTISRSEYTHAVRCTNNAYILGAMHLKMTTKTSTYISD